MEIHLNTKLEQEATATQYDMAGLPWNLVLFDSLVEDGYLSLFWIELVIQLT